MKSKRRFTAFICLFVLSVFILAVFVLAAAAATAETGTSDESGERDKIRIGYCQAGDYYEFDYQIYYIGMALTEASELESEQLLTLSQQDPAHTVWEALCNGSSSFYEFDRNSYFVITTGEFADLTEEEIRERLAALINENQIDLMITMGTSAGLAVRESCDVQYMNFIASDPVSSGITGWEDYSNDPRAWAHVNSGVEEKALDVMDSIFTSKKLGIVYDAENPEAYIYSGAVSVDEFAGQNGKEVVTESVSDEFDDTEEAYQNYYSEMLSAHKRLADSGIDIYILTTSYLRLEDFYDVLLPFMEKGIPVFSINSTEDVRCGALAAVEMLDYQNVGRFAVNNLKRYRSGVKLSVLEQKYATSPFLVINIDTMRRTGIQLPLDILISTSMIYGKYSESEEAL